MAGNYRVNSSNGWNRGSHGLMSTWDLIKRQATYLDKCLKLVCVVCVCVTWFEQPNMPLSADK